MHTGDRGAPAERAQKAEDDEMLNDLALTASAVAGAHAVYSFHPSASSPRLLNQRTALMTVE